MSVKHSSICRICTAYCPIEVELEHGQAVKISGARDYPLYGGYTCVKGRALHETNRNPARLLSSMKRKPDGTHTPIQTERAMREIADRLSAIIAEHGPRSVAMFVGQPTGLHPASGPVAGAFMQAIASPMFFSAATIDQPGMHVADALHGQWLGGRMAYADADAILIVGGNPVISKQYMSQNPARKLKDGVNAGGRLIVIDPRATETARRAEVHLQIKPGEDATVLASILHVLLDKGALDSAFIDQNVTGQRALEEAVKHFTPEYAAARAGVELESIVAAAEILAETRRCFVGGGTGIGMSGHGNLCYYLLLCIQSLRGFWPREGEVYANPSTLRAPSSPKAQPSSPHAVNFGEHMRVRNLRESVAGMPSSALMDEILTPGSGQIRALFCLSNPASSMPDTVKTTEALSSLELLVTPNVEMSETAHLSHYAIATKTILETPGATHFIESARAAHYGLGWDVPHAQYAPALCTPPVGADVIEDWVLFYRLAQHMGLQLSLPRASLDFAGGGLANQVALDMTHQPSTDDLFEILCSGSVIPLSTVKAHDGPHIYTEAITHVGSRDPDCMDRLDVGNTEMLAELAMIFAEQAGGDARFPFHLTVRRADAVVNSIMRTVPSIQKLPYNPAFLHPDDLAEIGARPGERVEIRSLHGAVIAIAGEDAALRRGVVSITHNFGSLPGSPDAPEKFGTNVNRLLSLDEGFDTVTGMPRMSAVPVNIRPAFSVASTV